MAKRPRKSPYTEKENDLLIQHSSDILVIAGFDGYWKRVNPSFAKILGWSTEELLARPSLDFVHPDDREAVLREVEAYKTGKEVTGFEDRYLCKDGTYRWICWNGHPLMDKGLIVSVGRDITERKRAEEELSRERDLLQSVMNGAIKSHLVYLDRDFNFVRVNETYAATCGYRPEQMIGKNHFDLYPNEENKAIFERVRDTGVPEKYHDRPFAFPDQPDRGVTYWDWTLTPIKSESGEVTGLVFSLMETTERKKTEEELFAHSRFFENMDKINRAMQGTNDLDQMMSDVLDTMLSIFDCDRAWLGFPCDPDVATFRIPMERSRPEYSGGSMIKADAGKDSHSFERMQIMSASSHAVTFGPNGDYPLAGGVPGCHGHQSQIGLTLRPKTGKPWILGMHQCSYPRIWMPEERKLFEEIGRRMEDSLTSFLAYRDLHESEERYRVILQTAMDGFWRTDMQGRLLEVNETYCRMSGFSADELLTMKVADLDAADTDDVIVARLRGLMDLGEDRCESVHRRKDGSIFDIEISTQYQPIAGGQSVAFLRDITERKGAEEALRSGERRLQAIIDGSPVPMFVIDKAHRIIHWNRALEEYTGVKAEDMIGTLSGQGRVFYQERRPCMADLLIDGALDEIPKWYPWTHSPSKLIEGGFEGVDFFPHIHGGSWLYFTAAPIHDTDGAVIGAVETLVDITDQKRLEEELVRSRDKLELRVQERTDELRRQAELLELSHEAILVKNLDGRIVFWSKGAEETYGWTKAEAIGNLTYQMLRTEAPISFTECRSVLMTQGRWDGEIVHTKKDGRRITVMSRQALQRDKNGTPMGIFELNVDITSERRLEDRLRQTHKLEAIGTLAGGIAHNFNNLVAIIMGNAELALDDVDEKSPISRNLAEIVKASLRARDHVNEILAFSRKSKAEQKIIRLAPLVHETFSLLRASLPSTITMDLRITATGDLVFGDTSQLQQVIMNLGTNAAHAMPDGGFLQIALSDVCFDSAKAPFDQELRPGEYIELLVRDTGCGMDEAVQRRIFEPFFTTKEVGKGTGLGLAVAYGIVKGCGGAILVESEPGRGSTFRVFLPKKTKDLNGAPKAKKTLPRGAGRILFVDDEESLGRIAASMLSRLGYEVTTESDPEKAFDRFRDNPDAFDAVITDYTMPGMTGFTLSKKILQVRPQTPILLCTGHNEAVDEESTKGAGIREFLVKPLRRQDLAEAVQRALAKTL